MYLYSRFLFSCNFGSWGAVINILSFLLSVHPTCMDYSPELTNRIKEFITLRNMNWSCIQCKLCKICNAKVMERPNSELQPVQVRVTVFCSYIHVHIR